MPDHAVSLVKYFPSTSDFTDLSSDFPDAFTSSIDLSSNFAEVFPGSTDLSYGKE
jgi:hypothetical protein